jgi:hypothetical protein
MLQNLALPVLRRVKPQLDGGCRARCDHHTLDLFGEKGALDKASAERAIRIAEQPCTFDPDDPVLREQNPYVGIGGHTRDARLVILT